MNSVLATNSFTNRDGTPLEQFPSAAGREFVEARNLLLRHREDYELAYSNFRWPAVTAFNWALDYFDPMATGNDRPALCFVSRSALKQVSFAEMSERSNRLANYLRCMGAKRGDTVLVMLGNELALWLATLAAIKLGTIILPTSPLTSASDLSDRMIRGGVKHVITGQELAIEHNATFRNSNRICVGDAPGWAPLSDYEFADPLFTPTELTGANDPLFIYFTSGTTAKPKIVVHSHQSYPIGNLSTMYWLGLQPGDVHFNLSSAGWGKHAWSSLFAPWNAEASILIADATRFNAKNVLSILKEYPVTTFCAPPTAWRMLIQEDLESYSTSLREVVSAGEPLNPEVIDKVRQAWGVTVRDGYGQTETTAQIGNTPGQPIVAGALGRPLPGFEIHALGGDGSVSSDGELAISLDPFPTGLMQGYLQPDGSTMRPSGPMYRTGDLASIDSRGYITFVGRTDDVFKSSGYRISPFELESMLLEHPFITEAAVVPAADPVRTIVPKAFIRLSDGCPATAETASQIFEHIRRRASPFKRIRRLQFCDLPKTASGKIIRADLRRRQESYDGVRQDDEFYEVDFSKPS
jgi:acetyl-CoA synthetase